MDALIQQAGAAIISWGPPGVLAILAIGAWWLERSDRRDAQSKLEDALKAWKADTQAQADKLASLVEGKRGPR